MSASTQVRILMTIAAVALIVLGMWMLGVPTGTSAVDKWIWHPLGVAAIAVAGRFVHLGILAKEPA